MGFDLVCETMEEFDKGLFPRRGVGGIILRTKDTASDCEEIRWRGIVRGECCGGVSILGGVSRLCLLFGVMVEKFCIVGGGAEEERIGSLLCCAVDGRLYPATGGMGRGLDVDALEVAIATFRCICSMEGVALRTILL